MAKEVPFKIPTNIAEVADLYGETKKQRLALAKDVAALEERERMLKEHLIENVPKSKATGVAGKIWRIAIVLKERVIVDSENGGWAAVEAWAKKNKLSPTEFLQKRLNEAVFKERLAAGKKIDGVRVDTYSDISLTGAGK